MYRRQKHGKATGPDDMAMKALLHGTSRLYTYLAIYYSPEGEYCKYSITRFHPNRFTFGGVLAERVTAVLLPHRVFS